MSGNQKAAFRASHLFSGSPQVARLQPIPTKALGKSLRVFRFGKAEHHELAADKLAATLRTRSLFLRLDTFSARSAT